MELIPSIDLRGGRVVRLEQGDYARETVYDADPVEHGAPLCRGRRAPRSTWSTSTARATAAPATPRSIRAILAAVPASSPSRSAAACARASAIDAALDAGAAAS